MQVAKETEETDTKKGEREERGLHAVQSEGEMEGAAALDPVEEEHGPEMVKVKVKREEYGVVMVPETAWQGPDVTTTVESLE